MIKNAPFRGWQTQRVCVIPEKRKHLYSETKKWRFMRLNSAGFNVFYSK